jgi:DNA-binding IclR family transcriptional regulator
MAQSQSRSKTENQTASPVSELRPSSANSTADRALDVLLSFTDETPIWSATDLAAQMQMPRSTLYRYLTSLRTCNMIAEDQSGRYRLGPRILQLARIARLNTSALQLALPHMRRLEERFGEMIVLKERMGWDTVNLETLPGRHRITLTPSRSQLLPWPAAPSAKLFAAYADPAEWKQLQGLMRPVAFTPHTVPSLKALKAQLATIRERGYSIGLDELDEGVRGVAVPIFQERRCRYSLSVAAPSFRLPDSALPEVIKAFLEAAATITAELESVGLT